MQKNFKSSICDFYVKYKKYIAICVIVIAFPLIYLLVYETGGIKYVYSHTMYIPILLAGIFFGLKFGLLAGLIGGLLLGPMMPLVVETGEEQEVINWVYRLIVFLLIGGIAGYFVDQYKKIIKMNEKLYSEHPDTGIHNINYLVQLPEDYIEDKVLIASVLINNKDKISEVLGTDLYIEAMALMFKMIKEKLPEKSVVIQADSEKFWIIFKLNDLNQDGKIIVKALTNQLDIKGIKIYIDYSVGVGEARNFKACQSLIPFRDSDRLAGYAKSNNLPYVIFDSELLFRKYEFNLLGIFPKALENNETFLVYQPVIDVKNKTVASIEALIRWQNEEYGLIMPNNFIPLVESTQLIHPMTNWVFQYAIEAQKTLKKNGYDLLMSINLSSKNLNNPSFFKQVMDMLHYEQASPNNFIFEVTETILLEEDKNSRTNIYRIKNAGFKISIDDFGKGYSSLTYLSQYDTDYLKIDRHFINEMVKNDSIHSIVKATVSLAHQFNLKVVAEGVETKEMYDQAIDLGIDYIQGFYLAKPMKMDDLNVWLKDFYKV